jgi:hypothetical protein
MGKYVTGPCLQSKDKLAAGMLLAAEIKDNLRIQNQNKPARNNKRPRLHSILHLTIEIFAKYEYELKIGYEISKGKPIRDPCFSLDGYFFGAKTQPHARAPPC